MRFHMAHVTKQFHSVCPKRFPSLWYVRVKPRTYIAPTLTLSPNRLKWDSTWPTSPKSSIGCIQNDFQAYGMFSANHASKMILEPVVCSVQTVHLSCADTNTLSLQTYQNEIPHDPRHLGIILRYDYHYLQTDQNELPLEPCHLAVPSGAFKMISRPMVCSTLAYLQMDWNKLPHEPHHLGVLLGASKMNSEPMVH
jgi:hypothetical protein